MNVFRLYVKLMKNKVSYVIIYGVLFFFLVVILSNTVQKKTFSGYEQEKISIAYIDEDEGSVLSEGLREYLAKYCDFVPVENDANEKVDAIFYGAVSCIITVPSGFSNQFLTEDRMKIETHAISGSADADYVEQAVKSYLNYVNLYHEMDKNTTLKAIAERISNEFPNGTKVIVDNKNIVPQKKTDDASYNILGYLLMSCFILIVCSAMNEFRNPSVYQRNEIAPITEVSIHAQLLLGNLVYLFVYTILFLGLAMALDTSAMFGLRTVLYWVNTFVYVISLLMFAYFFAMIPENRLRVNVLSNLLGLGLGFISGVFIRQEYLGGSVLKIASLSPMFWYIKGNEQISELENFDLSHIEELAKNWGVLLLFAVTYFTMSLAVIHYDRADKKISLT